MQVPNFLLITRNRSCPLSARRRHQNPPEAVVRPALLVKTTSTEVSSELLPPLRLNGTVSRNWPPKPVEFELPYQSWKACTGTVKTDVGRLAPGPAVKVSEVPVISRVLEYPET